MNSPERDIRDYLAGLSSLGLTTGTDLGDGEEPETPDAFVTVLDSGGEDGESAFTYDRPTIQVRSRGDKGGSKETNYSLIKSISDELHGLGNTTINDTRYIGIWRSGDIVSLGKDENKRWVHVANFRIHRTIDE